MTKTLWYPLDDAREKLGITTTELIDLIQSNKLTTGVYTDSIALVLLKSTELLEWVGESLCEYKGTLTVPKTIITTILDNIPTSLGGQLLGVSDRNGVHKVVRAPAYAREAFILEAHQFQDQPTTDQLALLAPQDPSLLAIQKQARLNDVLDAAFSNDANLQKELPRLRNALDETAAKEASITPQYVSNQTFTRESLRISDFSINHYLKEKNKAALPPNATASPPANKPNLSTKTIPVKKQQRLSAIYEVIGALIDDYPDVKPKELWYILWEDYEKDADSAYDRHGVINEMNDSEIIWQSQWRTEEQTLTRKSFRSAVHRIKRRQTDRN